MATPSPYCSFWIVDRTAGFCVFEQTFDGLPGDMPPDLLTGFISAMFTFSQEIVHSDVDHIQFKDDVRIVFHGNERLIFSLATRNSIKRADAKDFLVRVEGRFTTRYKDALAKGALNNVGVFEDFAGVIESELGVRSTSVGFFDSKVDDFAHYYEKKKKDWKLFQDRLLHQTRTIGTPLLSLVKNPVSFARYKIDDVARFIRKDGSGGESSKKT